MGSGITWSDVSAGAIHTCAIAKKRKSDQSGALCCWGGMARYDAYGRFDVFQKGKTYEYHGSAEDAEEEAINPLAIQHEGHDATPDDLVCNNEEPAAFSDGSECKNEFPMPVSEQHLSNAGELGPLCLGRFRGQSAVNVIGNPAHFWKEFCGGDTDADSASTVQRCSLHFASVSLRDTPNPLSLADKFTVAATARISRPATAWETRSMGRVTGRGRPVVASTIPPTRSRVPGCVVAGCATRRMFCSRQMQTPSLPRRGRAPRLQLQNA